MVSSASNQATLLKDRQVVEFTGEEGELIRFKYVVEEPTMITIETWPLNELSDPDLFVGVDKEDICKENCDWKSENIGPDMVTIYPDDAKFKTGTFCIAVLAFRPGTNHLGIRLVETEAKPIQ